MKRKDNNNDQHHNRQHHHHHRHQRLSDIIFYWDFIVIYEQRMRVILSMMDDVNGPANTTVFLYVEKMICWQMCDCRKAAIDLSHKVVCLNTVVQLNSENGRTTRYSDSQLMEMLHGPRHKDNNDENKKIERLKNSLTTLMPLFFVCVFSSSCAYRKRSFC